MTDLRTLTEAFGELERQADSVSAATTFTVPARRTRRRGPLIAAAAAGVLAVATGATLLTRADGSASHGAAAGGASSAAAQQTLTSSPPADPVPRTPEELARRLRTVLAGTASFTVTDTGAALTLPAPAAPRRVTPGGATQSRRPPAPVSAGAGTPNGAAIVGTLTAGGVTGGFDLQIFRTTDRRAWCDDAAPCTVTRRADGSSLALAHEPVLGGGVTYAANLIRPDGVEILMHVSNERDPKGESAVLAATPPLTRAQMAAIVTSGRW